MQKRVAILGIDLQNDFTKLTGMLYVKGAENDVSNLVRFIEKQGEHIDYMALTLDSHQPIHIAHQVYWKNAREQHPDYFSVITADSVRNKTWIPQYNVPMAIPYLEELEKSGGHCTIWPMHCILGTEGWSINQRLMDSLIEWSVFNDKSYELFYKGYAQNTEHYSIFKAAVEWENQPETKLNNHLLSVLNEFDELIIVGEAADYCVANSLNDIMKENKELAKKTVLFTDCMSWIVEDNKLANVVFEEARKMGVQFMSSSDWSI